MIITIANQKGGTGKTTLTSALSAGLAERNYRVLAVDLDAQMNLTSISGCLNNESENKTMYHCMKDLSMDFKEAIQKTALGYDLLLGDEQLANAESEFPDNTPNTFVIVRKILNSLSSEYDYILIDTPPGLGVLTTNAIMAAQKIIAPIEASTVSIQGLTQILETYQDLKDWNPNLLFDGVIINRLAGRANTTKEIVEEIQDASKKIHLHYYSPIRQSEYVSGAQANNQSIYQYMGKTKVANDFNTFVEEFLERN